MVINDRYLRIIQTLIDYYEIKPDRFEDAVRIKNNRYMLLLLLKSNNCFNIDNLKKLLKLRSRTAIINNLNKAEEKLLINKDFRESYFEIDNILKRKVRN